MVGWDPKMGRKAIFNRLQMCAWKNMQQKVQHDFILKNISLFCHILCFISSSVCTVFHRKHLDMIKKLKKLGLQFVIKEVVVRTS